MYVYTHTSIPICRYTYIYICTYSAYYTPADEQRLVQLYQSSVAWAIVICTLPAGMTRALTQRCCRRDLHRIRLSNFYTNAHSNLKLLSKSTRLDEEGQLSSQQYFDRTERRPSTSRALVVLKQCCWPGANLHGKAFEMLPPGHEPACGFRVGGLACILVQCFQSPACYICKSATWELLASFSSTGKSALFHRVYTTCLKRIGFEAHGSGCHRMSDSASPTSSLRPPKPPWIRQTVLE